MVERRNKSESTARSKRVPVSGNKNVMTVEGKDDGYVYRWVNDIDNRVQRFKAAGYENVDHEVEVGDESANRGSVVGKTVSKNVGHGTTSYLMRVKKEFYEEDMKEVQSTVDETEAAMKRSLNDGADGRYGKVNIK